MRREDEPLENRSTTEEPNAGDCESGKEGEKSGKRSLQGGEKSFGAGGRGSKLDAADKDTEGRKRGKKPSLTRERSEGVRAQSGKEEEEKEERQPDRRSSLRGLD